jgi:hypothetical protein
VKLKLPKVNTCLFFCLLGLGIGYSNFSQSQKASGLPRIGFSVGGFTGFTDIKSKDYKPGLNYKMAYQIYVDKPLLKPLSLGLNFITGKIYGSQTIQGYDINFQTTVFSQSLRLNYNFFPFIKTKAKNRFYPFVGLGIGMLAWRSKGDYKDQDGKFYSDYDSSQPVAKDHIFETDLRQANLDRFGKYPQVTLEIPVFLGLDIRIKKGLNARVNAEYHIGFSDMLDNVSSKGLGARQGKSGYDNLLAISAGVNYNLAYAEEDDSKPQDLDLDGIVDSKDKCDNTPAGVRVDKKGCPVDDNNNGTADYLEEGTMANQDFKNNQDPNKPAPVISTESKSNGTENQVSDSNTTNKNSKENSVETQEALKGKTTSTLVSAQDEVDSNGRNEGGQTGITAESSGNRKQTTATLEEDGKAPVSLETDRKSNTAEEGLSKNGVNNGTTEKEVKPKGKGKRKQEAQLEEQVGVNVMVAENSTSTGKTQEDVNSGVDSKTSESSESAGQSGKEVTQAKNQPTAEQADTKTDNKENQMRGRNENSKQSNTKSSTSTSNISQEGELTDSKSASTKPLEPNSGLIKGQEKAAAGQVDSQTRDVSASSSDSATDAKAENGGSTISNENGQTTADSVKVVKMDADEDFSTNSTKSKNGIDLTDAKTAKAQFEKAAGASTGKNEPMSAVDLSARLGRFAFADINKNGKISVSEVNHFIDEFFENGEELNLKVSDIRDLIDFYFEQ